jgi:hypothetical protein
MITIRLTVEEARTLREIIDYTLSELRMEIAGTESYDWRRELHDRKALLNKMLDQLQEISSSRLT